MAFTSGEETRIKLVEDVLIDVQKAIKNLASKTQMRQLLLLKQTEVDELTKRIETLEAEVEILRSDRE